MRFHESIRRNMRAPRLFGLIRRRIGAAKLGGGCRICHFSVQRNHIHLIVEPPSGPRGKAIAAAVSNAMRGLAIRIARALNARLDRRGGAFAHRYDCRELTNPLAVKNALNYVIHNRKKHAHSDGTPEPSGFVDPCSSAAFVAVWSRQSRHSAKPRPPTDDDPVVLPRTWLLKTGWHQKHGGLDEFASI